jgi:hypothetical protein
MARMLLARRVAALSVGLASGLAVAALGSHGGDAASVVVPAPTLPGGIVRAQARPEPQKQPKKVLPRPAAPGAQSQPKAETRQDKPRELEQPPQLVRCPGPSPECPPDRM